MTTFAPDQLEPLLRSLIAKWEGEVVEFKQADNDFSTSEIGRYFSALSNEANLRGAAWGWLVFGVHNKTRSAVGTAFRPGREHLQSLKHQITQNSQPKLTFREIYDTTLDGHRVVMMQVAPAPAGSPVSWDGHWYGRSGESLGALGQAKIDEIRGQAELDWSAVAVPSLGVDAMDPEAMTVARTAYAAKHSAKIAAEEVAGWDDAVFLDRLRLLKDGAPTRAAVLLLGRFAAAIELTPHPAELTWKLEGQERAYEHFGPPFLLSSSRLYQRIRNVEVSLLPEGSLVPLKLDKYDRKIVLEALHNGIAHQDYARHARVLVTEYVDRLEFSSVGGFFEGRPEDYFLRSSTPQRYRNRCLTQAMAALNMIDTLGYGIRSMVAGQRRRHFPLPDYDLSDPGRVRLTLYGKVLDEAYTQVLMRQTELPLEDVVLLDRVQKGLKIDEAAVKRLRRAKLVEGRRPQLHISASVAEMTGEKNTYILQRRQEDAFLKKLVLDSLGSFGDAPREQLEQLLVDKLGDGYTADQRVNRVRNLLAAMRREGLVEARREGGAWRWRAVKPEGGGGG